MGISGSARILLVDDEPSVLELFKVVLETGGFEVTTATTGEEAVETFGRGTFDAIVTDLTMPGMDGMELLRHVRQTDLDVPVVIVTAAPSMQTAIQAVEYGALRYLLKPVRNAELVEVVGKAVRLHQLARLKRQALALTGVLDKDIGDQAGLEAIFDDALARLHVLYQPIISWTDRRVHAFEALVRSGAEKMPHPGALFDAAERLGRVDDLGRAIRRLAPLPFKDGGPLLFVNLHPDDLGDEDLYGKDTPLAQCADRVVLEITERASLDRVPDAHARVTQLRSMGFRIAVDDLGAGYAGLTSFSLLEPDVVKLDMAMIRDVHKSDTKRKLIASMARLCDDLGIEVVAEGVEVIDERDVLADIGCTYQQGFLFSKPGPAFPDIDW